MNVGNVIKTLGRKAAFKLKLHKAEILTGVGLVGMVTGTALAIKETRTVEPILLTIRSKLSVSKTLVLSASSSK